MIPKLESKKWWSLVSEDIQELLKESLMLLENVPLWTGNNEFHDYSFIVFPAAKAYEGFLKVMLYKSELITNEEYYGKHFRLGKALNPQLGHKYTEVETVYDKLVSHCEGENVANRLWETWKSCRNILFHWFPDEKNAIDYSMARQRVLLIIDTMDLVFTECRINK